MADGSLPLQLAIKNHLTAGSPPAFSWPVYTGRAPQVASFPYAVILGFNGLPWDTKTDTGQEILVTIDVWSRGGPVSTAQPGQMMAALYAALHEAELTVTGQDTVSCEYDFSDLIPDADGQTWHGVFRVRVFLSAA